MKLMLVWQKDEKINDFQKELAASDMEIISLSSGKEALEFAKNNTDITLAVTAANLPDMTGLEFAEKLLGVNAMIGCAVASDLDHEDFHETSEGLGILMQLPLKPNAENGRELISRLTRIGLIANANLKQQ